MIDVDRILEFSGLLVAQLSDEPPSRLPSPTWRTVLLLRDEVDRAGWRLQAMPGLEEIARRVPYTPRPARLEQSLVDGELVPAYRLSDLERLEELICPRCDGAVAIRVPIGPDLTLVTSCDVCLGERHVWRLRKEATS